MYRKFKPGQILVASYGAVGLAGTLLLMLPWASTQPSGTSFLDAWFTAISALTVTGLTVVNTGDHWTLFGQAVILVLMQVGGLGLMVLATLFLILMGLRIHLGYRVLAAQDRNYFNFTGVVRLVKSIILLTLAIEGAGALFLAFFLPEVWQEGILRGGFFLIFHAVSAFNGAGFDLTGTSFYPFREELGFNIVIMVLILLGSLGFVVLNELIGIRKNKSRRLSLHSRLVLWVTGGITIFGSVFYFGTEFSQGLSGLPLSQKVVESLFQTVTRTAGFETVPASAWGEPFQVLMILMMFIGASPGSVGGGIKTTTFGTIILAIWAIAGGKKEVVVLEREIARESVDKAFTVTIMAFILAFISTLALMVIEGQPFMPVLFEVVSALATVGLSLGVTAQLSPIGLFIISLLMFIGRIGVLSLVYFLAQKENRRFRYMKEEILIG
jgi:trk system potassium uptake protein TrkH